MEKKLVQLKSLAKKNKKANQKFLQQLKRKNDREIDHIIHDMHEEVFSCTDCLKCANCCKTTGPLFTNKDIERISKHLRLKPQAFIEQYLRIDEDNDYVLQQVPCAFLGEDNYCSIYDHRPKACREFPHTDRVKQSQLFTLILKNTEVCPAVYDIVEKLKEKLS
jgi:Fe-S-cluster containining protein